MPQMPQEYTNFTNFLLQTKNNSIPNLLYKSL